MPKSKCGRALVADRVPIVQLMFLYEARARASYRNISCTIGNPFWHDWDQEGSKT